ncbi:zinc finger BED domain-containing protein RICESLEEPER 3-like [Neltuma alba]|uniref:zinc finger BED domain-containing protein RICESLEEPER 3-like n=1 Tax=Neltuma alba TaxID=207710 RepID=UPI0010A547CD|nr:zinc finger BED domain-containing protein RICESLEEPER 3-like [Prosopis alba]
MKPRSKVWKHFTKFVNERGETRGKCNYCEKDLACDSKANGITALNNHLNACKLKPPPEELAQSHLNFNVDEKMGLTNWKFDQDATRKALSCMIIIDELPFKFVDGDGFRQFMAIAQPRFKIPSRWTVAPDCFGIYIDEKVKI